MLWIAAQGCFFLVVLQFFQTCYCMEEKEEIAKNCSEMKTFRYQCADGKTCIPRKHFCDGTPQCPDNSDEIQYNETLHSGKGVLCKPGKDRNTCFLGNQHVCDHDIDCESGIDESNCSSTFQCEDNSVALRIQFCNRKEDCKDGSDEKPYSKLNGGFQCQVSKRQTTSTCTLPEVHVCDGVSECNWGTDECFCNNGEQTDAYSNEKCFRCLDGTLVVPEVHVCDGVVHCKDFSDECLCNDRIKTDSMTRLCKNICIDKSCDCRGHLQCTPRNVSANTAENFCLPWDSVCDNNIDCDDGIDEEYCPFLDEFFYCADGKKKIRKGLVCDGLNDCDDKSDEDDCHTSHVVCAFYTTEFSHRLNWTHNEGWNLTDEHPKLNRTSVDQDLLHNNYTLLEGSAPYYAVACDGIPNCLTGSDECSRNGKKQCSTDYEFCPFVNNTMLCSNSYSHLSGFEVCDGYPTCNDTAPHLSDDEKGCSGRFYCENRGKTRMPIHIPESHRCDGVVECDDKSDEIGCSNKTHFYCNDSGPKLFVALGQKCDKRQDCLEGADECDNCIQDAFASDERLISSRVLVAFLWITGVLSTSGNFIIVCHQISALSKKKFRSCNVSFINRFLILNLATADLLMGIYLVALGIKDATVTEYCKTDQVWRSSSTCTGLGVMALIGTEASVIILLIMTSYRLRLMVKPLEQQQISHIHVAVLFGWVSSFILATVPLAPSTAEYFLSCVWFRNHRYLGYACRDEMEHFTKTFIALGAENLTSSQPTDYTWHEMLEAQKLLNESYVPERYYGYYSAHSVCLPRFFPRKQDDTSWGYSLFLIILNFFAFLYIMIGYIYIYKYGTRRNFQTERRERQSKSIQNKITRIVLTDFCCWIPICIMAFLSVAGIEVGDIAYAFTAVILLPINSAMNPFLYSPLLDIMWNRLRPIQRGVSMITMNSRVSFLSSERKGRTASTSSGQSLTLNRNKEPKNESTEVSEKTSVHQL